MTTCSFARVPDPPKLSPWWSQVHAYEPSSAVWLELQGEGTAPFPLFELPHALKAARIFRGCVESARTSHGAFGACLHLYSTTEYATMRLFLDEAGLSGFALKADEIVSVFNHAAMRGRRATRTLLSVAVNAGGSRLNAFDTVLPGLYGKCGFIPVARLAWSDALAPKDWDYDGTASFNGGRPDVVFMVSWTKSLSARVSSFEDGLRVQTSALNWKCFAEVA